MGGLKDSLSKTLDPGMTVGGHYRIEIRLGVGGFGEVWMAQDTHSGDIVAVKMPLHQFAIKPKVVESLKHECNILKTLTHPNICRLIDLAYDPVYGPLLITEYMDGTDLKTATTGMHWDDQVALFIQALQGLDYLHGQPTPVMHLDIKPQNMLVANGRLKLIDFGISGFKPPAKTAGTYSYMSPEMIVDAQAVTTRADLYSMGIVMYQCLTGKQPFSTGDVEKTKRLQKEVYPRPPTEEKKGLPSWIDIFIMKLLDKNPSHRYGSAKEALRELQLLRDKPVEDAAHLQSFAAASGSFIGRHDIRQAVQQVGFFAHIIRGDVGSGKTRILKEIKFDAQPNQLQTIVIESPEEATAAMLAPATEAMNAATMPVLILLDDYDKWCAGAPNLAGLLNTIQTHPGLPTRIGCVMAMTQVPDQWRASGAQLHELNPFTVQEVGEYLGAVANVPEPQRSQMAEQLWQYTQGNPGRLAKTMTRLVEQRYFASGAGQWDPSLFEDVTIDMTATHDDDENVTPPEDVPKFLVQAAETALGHGKVREALKLMDQFPECHDGLVMLWKGILLTAVSELLAAQQVLSDAQATAEGHHDKVLALRIRNQLACILFKSGKSEEALEAYRQTAFEEASLGASDRDSILNNDLGYLLLRAERFDEAQLLLKELMMRADRAGKVRRSILAQTQLGDCLVRLHQIPEAREMLLIAIRRARTAQQQDLLSYAYNQLANSYVIESEQKEAVEILKRAIPLNYFLNDLRSVATNTTNYGLGLIRNGEYEEAKHKLQVAYEYIQKSDDLIKECMVPYLVGQAEIAKYEGKMAEANPFLDRAEEVAHQYNVWNKHAYSILMTRAEVRRGEGNLSQAQELAMMAEPHAQPGREKQEVSSFVFHLLIQSPLL